MAHCDFKPNGRDRCDREASRQFHIVREYLADGGKLVEELNICDECLPRAKKLWKAHRMESKELGKKKTKS